MYYTNLEVITYTMLSHYTKPLDLAHILLDISIGFITHDS